MPKVFEWKGCKFFFYANEGDPLEPYHIHVRKGGCTAKFWLDPDVMIAASYGFSSKELHKLRDVIVAHDDLIRRKWNEFFSH